MTDPSATPDQPGQPTQQPAQPPVSPYAAYPGHPRYVDEHGQTAQWTTDGLLTRDGNLAAVGEGPQERVGLGLLASLGGVVLGCVATWLVWRAGYIASITSLLTAISAAFLYQAGAGAPARRGIVPLVLVIVFGVVASFYTMYISDLGLAFDQFGGVGSKREFIRANLFNLEAISAYGTDLLFFIGFGVLGVFGTVRRLMAQYS
jgi:hypothetical protein